ncbi:hypothetical protein ACFSR7_26760 [Cohnella sp. GCM10020058]|uniref:hypothetical protein n=1 Tax=Cohnella sp. GCM10020058 TaxID=3317330 RepID=UPI0036277F74
MTITGGKGTEMSIPIHIQPFRQAYARPLAEQIAQAQAKRVFLAASIHIGHLPDLALVKEEAAILKTSIEMYRKLGVEAAYWGNTIGHGGSLVEGATREFQQIVGPSGEAVKGAYCPLDEAFKAYLGEVYGTIAESGVEMVMLDDDFRLHSRSEAPVGCFCPLHMNEFRKRAGIKIDREQLVEIVLHGETSPLRSLWLEVIGDSLLGLASVIERAVHEVNAQARLGLCAVMSHWTHEGVEMERLLRTLSGSTRPFVRTIGAPYWSKEPHRIGWIVEYTRWQMHWLRNIDVDIMAEGDTFPQNRFHCPAADLNAFNLGIRAAGVPGILQYVLHFSFSAGLETGYLEMIEEKRKLYSAIESFCPPHYCSKGVKPSMDPYSFERIKLPESGSTAHYDWPDPPVSLQMLSRLGIPVSHDDDEGPVWLSGFSASSLPHDELMRLLDRGAVVDGPAAQWLIDRGIDIGLMTIRTAETPVFERYVDEGICGKYAGEYMWLIGYGPSGFYEGELQAGARIVTEFLGLCLKPMRPAVIHYENAEGQRFCILPFDLQEAILSKQLVFNYARQAQLASSLAWINRNALPATLPDHPDVHLMCRAAPDGERLVIVIHNLSLDPIVRPLLQLNPNLRLSGTMEWLNSDGLVVADPEYRYDVDDRFGYLRLETTLSPLGWMAVAIGNPRG